jgi:hypothetical protein
MVKYLLHKIIDIGTFAKKCHLYCSRGHVFLLDMFCKNKQKYGLVIVTIINMTSFCSISFLSLFLSKEVAQKGSHFYIFDFPVKFSVFVTTISSLFLGTKTSTQKCVHRSGYHIPNSDYSFWVRNNFF